MIIHVVQPGDTIYSIAQKHNVSPEKIIRDNNLENPNMLVPGQTIVVLVPEQIYTIKSGDTLSGIARAYGTTAMELLRNNPYISDANNIAPGEEIVIRYNNQKRGPIMINGYAYPFINRETLVKTLPYLTYLTMFSYGMKENGDLIDIDDEELIQLAKAYNTVPIMLIASLGEDGLFSGELTHKILNNEEARRNLIENVLKTIERKGYMGLDVDFEYVFPEDKEIYAQFIQEITSALNEKGYLVFTALAAKSSEEQTGILYEAHDYNAIGEAANRVLLMTYEWGYAYGPPMAVAPIDKVEEVLEYAQTAINPKKTYLGIPNYGYDFKLPYVEGVSKAQSLSNVNAIRLAREVGAQIKYDEQSQSPYFTYYDKEGKEHIVWFEDAESIEAKLDLFSEYGLEGISFWNIMNYFPQSWLVINSLYDVVKLL